ncbi:glycosyltransferase, partial [Vibrio harveyi]|nr:glycosyltransferase [Vibrio harveyi]
YYGYSRALKNNRTFKQTLLHLRGAFLQKIATHKKINVAVSSSVKTVLENQNIKVDYVLPNAVIDDRFDVHKQEKTRRNGKILLVTSNNYYAKGMDIVDEIISKFGYSIDYASPTENKKTLANYIGHLSKDELIDAYSKYSFVILPSRFEGMSMAIIESCMTGTPFLTSKVGHWLEVSNYCPDFIVEENKPEFFDAKFKLLASDFEKYSNVARNIYDNEHTLTIYQDRVENILLGIDYGAK